MQGMVGFDGPPRPGFALDGCRLLQRQDWFTQEKAAKVLASIIDARPKTSLAFNSGVLSTDDAALLGGPDSAEQACVSLLYSRILVSGTGATRQGRGKATKRTCRGKPVHSTVHIRSGPSQPISGPFWSSRPLPASAGVPIVRQSSQYR